MADDGFDSGAPAQLAFGLAADPALLARQLLKRRSHGELFRLGYGRDFSPYKVSEFLHTDFPTP